MVRRAGLAGALVLGLAACGGPAPSPSIGRVTAPAPTPTSVAPPPSPSPAVGADLVIVGSGSVPCPIPGCRASVELVPGLAPTASLDPAFQPVGGWAFDLDHATTVGGTAKIGSIIGAPAAIAPGTYRVVGAIGIVSDVSSGEPDASGHYPLVLLGWDLCDAPLAVANEATSVRIDVEFTKAGGCTVTTGVGIP
jgi:hypothetical protein